MVSHEDYLVRKKTNKLTEADTKLWESFIDRQLRQTQYISKKSISILSQICNNITTTEGSVTAALRNAWGWDAVLMSLQMPKYKALGQTKMTEWTSDHGTRTHKKEEIINWTKRDDHRHHAIDALVVACTKQGYIQRINTLNASDTKDLMRQKIEEVRVQAEVRHNGKKKLLEKYLAALKPYFHSQVARHADQILISHKAGKKAATYALVKAKKNGVRKVVQTGIVVPRGPLHEETVYGKIKTVTPDCDLNFLFDNPKSIISPKIMALVSGRLAEHDNNTTKAKNSLKKNPLYLDENGKIRLEKAACYQEKMVVKYPIGSIKTKDVPYIVDGRVRQLVDKRLAAHNGKELAAFKTTLWFNEEKQIPILTVRLFTGLSAVQAVKKDENGKEIGFALPKNNHHAAIYKDAHGTLSQHICTFWAAVDRKRNKIPNIIKDTNALWTGIAGQNLPQDFLNTLPADNLTLEYSMQQNEMFILGMPQETLDDAIKANNKPLLSKHLYLVWKLANNAYWFRHHLETKVSELIDKDLKAQAKESKRFYEITSMGALQKINPIKVRRNHLGEITKIGE